VREIVEVPVFSHDTLIVTTTARDSIFIHDSIYQHDYARNDTVFIETTRWKLSYRDRVCTDTVYQSKTDSIPYPVEVVKEVEKELTWWQTTRLYIANFLLLILAIYVGWKFLGKKLI